MIPTYEEYFKTIMHGKPASPRGLVVREVFNANLRFRPGEILGRDKLNVNLGLMEGLQFVAGVFMKDWIAAIAPHARLDLFTLQAAYGPRGEGQFASAINALRVDPLTRRAVVILPTWSEGGTADAPCTTSLTFYIREGKLNATIHMRSSDAVWGLPYDVMQFGLVTQVMAKVLGVQAQSVLLQIVNGHIYDGTQHLVPNGRGGSFEVTADLKSWGSAMDWAWTNAQAMTEGKALEGVVVNA